MNTQPIGWIVRQRRQIISVPTDGPQHAVYIACEFLLSHLLAQIYALVAGSVIRHIHIQQLGYPHAQDPPDHRLDPAFCKGGQHMVDVKEMVQGGIHHRADPMGFPLGQAGQRILQPQIGVRAGIRNIQQGF